MKYLSESGDTVEGIARKLGYPGGGADLLQQGGNRDALLDQLVQQSTLGPGVELDLPGEWDALPTNMTYNPDTHMPPQNGQPPTPLSADQRRARASLSPAGEPPASPAPPASRPESPSASVSPPAPKGDPTLGGVPT